MMIKMKMMRIIKRKITTTATKSFNYKTKIIGKTSDNGSR